MKRSALRASGRGVLLLVAVALFGACGSGDGEAGATPPARAPSWALAIHGGAGVPVGSLDDAQQRAYLESLERALRRGVAVLEGGGSSLDAVELVVRDMEDDPLFNAGKGAVFNRDGRNELDASIMDGATLACGAVAAVRTVKNPIVLARLVMERTPHVLLGQEGAERFAAEAGLEPVSPDYFFTERRWEALQRRREERVGEDGTVGAVALDREGNLAAATSTGGLTGKRSGRVGDSPIIGAGTYADNTTCAVSGTGKGEEFIRHSVAHAVSALIEHRRMDLRQAAEYVIEQKLQPGDGGVIALDRHGRIAMVFNTPGMFRGAADSAGRFEVHIWE